MPTSEDYRQTANRTAQLAYVGFRQHSGKHLLAVRFSQVDRCCRKSLREGTVELEYETNESRQADF